MSDAFRVGFQIAAPVLVTGFLLYLGAGLLNRLMPRMMVFFVIMPVQVTLGFAVLLLSMGAGLMWFMTFMDETVMRCAGPF